MIKNSLSTLLVICVVLGSLIAIRYLNVQEQDHAPVFYVDAVIDGDTFISGNQRIRLWGIDAPETDHFYFSTSKLYLEALIEDASLKCVWVNNDKYKREAMRCKLGEGDIAAIMVREGMAVDYKDYSNGFYQGEEKEAKRNKRGLWKE